MRAQPLITSARAFHGVPLFMATSLILAVLVACAISAPQVAPSDHVPISNLAAKKVVAHYLSDEWAERPYVTCDQEPHVRPIKYADIERLRVNPRKRWAGGIAIWGREENCRIFADTGWVYWPSTKLTPEQAHELVAALHALGAAALRE